MFEIKAEAFANGEDGADGSQRTSVARRRFARPPAGSTTAGRGSPSRRVGSALYLAAIGSALGFLAYLALVARIGPERAGYATVLSPVIALAISWLLEGYQWSPWALIGAPLILVGNVVIFLPKFGRDMIRDQPSSLQAEAAPGE